MTRFNRLQTEERRERKRRRDEEKARKDEEMTMVVDGGAPSLPPSHRSSTDLGSAVGRSQSGPAGGPAAAEIQLPAAGGTTGSSTGSREAS